MNVLIELKIELILLSKVIYIIASGMLIKSIHPIDHLPSSPSNFLSHMS